MAELACTAKGITSVNAAINFVTSHPSIAIGVGIGLALAFVIHMISRIQRLLVTVVVMGVAGGGVAGSGAAGGVAQFAQNLMQHFH
ncbi:hypothetical protein FZI85_14905 [Mycobacterium sp. CBMA293]|nr:MULTISPECIES: hypothetical protein [unclassified Mycolicibacterium]MUM31662.1 hypothetical protein [Mycolicibacterium sp. CBMA 361]MUL48312.1 hypothetical protein [Mycolicibacterium sp. CBMA 360]MUL57521.1 hypothetical protein [Mycolicibacterium sp. CBMA 335]MUL70561.1 hypothetical protein [Mycolicibacterium sp. CBMA 311]MUL92609.1 hypothetical protein [Mycolicibacterium sp. CBMA 230]